MNNHDEQGYASPIRRTREARVIWLPSARLPVWCYTAAAYLIGAAVALAAPAGDGSHRSVERIAALGLGLVMLLISLYLLSGRIERHDDNIELSAPFRHACLARSELEVSAIGARGGRIEVRVTHQRRGFRLIGRASSLHEILE